jgi:ankyrin repeat protein
LIFHSGTRPLHWAAHRGLVAIAGMLLDKRADVNSKDNGFGHFLQLRVRDMLFFYTHW